ncbi:MAG: DUF6491 family protein [bacterium]
MQRFTKNTFSILGLVAVTTLFTASAAALPYEGERVDSFTSVSSDSTWEVLDYQHVVVTLNEKQRYLLTLTHMCPKLAVTAKLGISSSGDTVYAGFDYITADGERCLIKDIARLNA